MLQRGWNGVSGGRVNPVFPALVVVSGCAVAAAGNRAVGAGVAVGAILAYVNGLVLSRRIDLASLTGNVGGAMLVMQAGLLVSLTIVGLTTIVLVKISVAMAVASAAGFAAAQFAILAAFYWSHGRQSTAQEPQA